MTEGMKDLIFAEERKIDKEPQYRLINWLTKEEIDRIAWALDYEELTIIEGNTEEKRRR